MGRMTPTPYTVESPLLHTHILHHQRLESPLEQLNVSMAEQDKRNAEHMTTQSLQPQTHYTNKCKHTHIYLWVPPTGYVVCMDPYVNMHVFVVVHACICGCTRIGPHGQGNQKYIRNTCNHFFTYNFSFSPN